MAHSGQSPSQRRKPSRRTLLKNAAAAIVGPTILSCSRTRETNDHPNIVLFVADDFGIDAMPSYGAEHFDTPRLDRLSAEGLRFGNCYATPLCSPSRVELMTGLYPFRTGWTKNILDRVDDGDRADLPIFLDPKYRTIATELKELGYATAVAGKWQLCYFDEHPDHCRELGFDEYCVWLFQVFDREKNAWTYSSRYWLPSIYQNGERRISIPNRYGPDIHTDFAIDFMTRNREKPFFAYLPFALPHKPYQDTPAQLDPSKVTAEPAEETSNYRRMVTYMDSLVGRVIDAIDELGLSDNTLILFTSDNGTPTDVTVRFRNVTRNGGKGTLSEAGTRVPLLARWPGVITPGRGSTQLVDLSDFLPTLAALAGRTTPLAGPIDGMSFLPILRGGRESMRKHVFSMLGDERFVRGPQYKLYSDGRFFDVMADPTESRDLRDDPKIAGERQRLAQAMRSLTEKH